MLIFFLIILLIGGTVACVIFATMNNLHLKQKELNELLNTYHQTLMQFNKKAAYLVAICTNVDSVEAQMIYIAIKNLRMRHSDLHIVANVLNRIGQYYPKNIKPNLIEQLRFFTTQLTITQTKYNQAAKSYNKSLKTHWITFINYNHDFKSAPYLL